MEGSNDQTRKRPPEWVRSFDFDYGLHTTYKMFVKNIFRELWVRTHPEEAPSTPSYKWSAEAEEKFDLYLGDVYQKAIDEHTSLHEHEFRYLYKAAVQLLMERHLDPNHEVNEVGSIQSLDSQSATKDR